MREKPSKSAKEKSKLSKEEWREYTKTVWSIANTTHPDHPAVFPLEIPARLIKLFSYWGELVLDPFGGSGVTAQAAIELGRSSVCYEQNAKFAGIARRRIAKLAAHEGVEKARIVTGDCRNMSAVDSDSVQLIVTSPPYWDKADYGGGSQDIGRRSSYDNFLERMREAFEECYRVLAPGRKACVVTANVNQHTEHGLLTFPIASDLIVLMRSVGFVLVTEIVWSKDGTGGRWGSSSSQRPIFGSYPYPPNFLFKNVHEYIIVAAKPSGNTKLGPKARKYSEIMGALVDG